MLPGILNHLGPEGLTHLKKMALAGSAASNSRLLSTLGEENDDIPDLVENFESQLGTGAAGKSSDAPKPPVEVVD
jgi:hypothetical protein